MMSETEEAALATLERHLRGALGAIKQLKKTRSTFVLRELRVSRALATVDGLRRYLRDEKERRSHG